MKQPRSSYPLVAIAFVVVLFLIPFAMIVCRGPADADQPPRATPTPPTPAWAATMISAPTLIPEPTLAPTPVPTVTAYVLVGTVAPTLAPSATSTPAPSPTATSVPPGTPVMVPAFRPSSEFQTATPRPTDEQPHPPAPAQIPRR